jgi:NTP pyrophosphatase (non-canonical NTP hydrolase)
MANDAQPYGIGSDVWPGLAKALEEMGELSQVLGKVMACDGDQAIYWDGRSLVPDIVDEIGDVMAALIFFVTANSDVIEVGAIKARQNLKIEKFLHWHKVHSGGETGDS